MKACAAIDCRKRSPRKHGVGPVGSLIASRLIARQAITRNS
jgi:hypothetical protein